MPSQQDIQQLQERLAAHRATLATLLTQQATLGSAYAPPGVASGIREARAGIATCKANLRRWGAVVEDLPDDETAGSSPASPPSVPTAANHLDAFLQSVLPTLPEAQQAALSRRLTALLDGEPSPETLRERLLADADLAPLLAALAGQQIQAGSSLISFGAGTQVGDVAIRDVVGGDMVTLNVYYDTARAAPVAPAPADTLVRPLSVFLCHASGDKPAVRQLYQRLRADGFAPWLDQEELIPGQEWQREIPRAVHTADVVVVCLSPTALTRAGYVQKEIGFALDIAQQQPEGAIFLIPLRLAECDVPERLSRWQWVDYFEEQGYNRLVRALRIRANQLAFVAEAPEAAHPTPNLAPARDVPPLAPGKPTLNPRDQRLVAARGLVVLKSWAEAVAAYEALAAHATLPDRDAQNLQRSQHELWLKQTWAKAEACEARWDWAAAVISWDLIASRRPDHVETAARLQRAREEQALAEQAQDVADLVALPDWDAALAMIAEIERQRPGYRHPKIDLAALQQQAQAALRDERAVEQAEQGDWAGVIATLSAENAVSSPASQKLRKHAKAMLAAEAQRQAAEAQARQEAEARREREEAERRQRERCGPILDQIQTGGFDQALAQLETLLANTPADREAAELAARIIETPAAPFNERLRAARLVGKVGDPRIPVDARQWRTEIARRSEMFGTPSGYWCYLPQGKYQIGGWNSEQQSASIQLSAFWVARYPITVAQYASFIPEGYGKPAEHAYWWTNEGWDWKQQAKSRQPWGWDDQKYRFPNQPVIGVNWYEATAYCTWLTDQLQDVLPKGYILRLLTEAEWEVSAAYDKRRQRRSYPWGEGELSSDRAVYNVSNLRSPAPVGCCPSGMAACGAVDMVGNVCELMTSDYQSYPAESHRLQRKKDFTNWQIACRGGSYYQNSTFIRCAARGSLLLHEWRNHVGFRIVLALPLPH